MTNQLITTTGNEAITKSVENIDARIAELSKNMVNWGILVSDHKMTYPNYVIEFNKASKEIEMLNKAKYQFVTSQVPTSENHNMSPRDLWAMQNGNSSVIGHSGIADHSKYMKNMAFKQVADGLEVVKNNVLAARETMDIITYQIMPFAKVDRYKRWGSITFEIPEGLLEVKVWNGSEFIWVPMLGRKEFYNANGKLEEMYFAHNFNAFNSSKKRLLTPEVGTPGGYITLAIKQWDDGTPYIVWPKSQNKKDPKKPYDVFKTKHARFGTYHTDNNLNVQAALNAFLLTYWSALEQSNPDNRAGGFNEHCGNCPNMIYMPQHDQMGDDYENKANPVDTSELGQWGSRIPQWICGVTGEFVDKDAIDDLNESASFEINSYIDTETGTLRFLRAGQVLIKGKPVSVYNVRAEGSKERCAKCPFYSKNERKSDNQIAKELMKKTLEMEAQGIVVNADSKPYISKYWTQRPIAQSMPVFTHHKDNGTATWDLGFPGQFSTPSEFMVQGLGGVNVYGTYEMMKTQPAKFVAKVEAFRAEEVQLAKIINIIHTMCNNFVDFTEDKQEALISIIGRTPAPTKPWLASRWESAINRLVGMIKENQANPVTV